MATYGHINEKEWSDLSDQFARKAAKLIEILAELDEMHLRNEDLWTARGASDQAVADQLFRSRFDSAAGKTAADANEVAMADDLHQAGLAVHRIFGGADLAAIRKIS